MDNEINDNQFSWDEWLAAEDRKLDNADRRYRYHNKSFDAMGDKTVESESDRTHISFDEMLIEQEMVNFFETIQNIKFRKAIQNLTYKQQTIIRLIFWDGYNQYEAAELMVCERSAISKILSRAKESISSAMK